MKITIQNGLNEFDHSIEEHIHRKLRLELSKMAANISTISFVISEAIGIGGETENHCSLTLSLYGMPNLVIEETNADLYFAIDRVIQKTTRSLSRKLSL